MNSFTYKPSVPPEVRRADLCRGSLPFTRTIPVCFKHRFDSVSQPGKQGFWLRERSQGHQKGDGDWHFHGHTCVLEHLHVRSLPLCIPFIRVDWVPRLYGSQQVSFERNPWLQTSLQTFYSSSIDLFPPITPVPFDNLFPCPPCRVLPDIPRNVVEFLFRSTTVPPSPLVKAFFNHKVLVLVWFLVEVKEIVKSQQEWPLK